MSAVFDAYARYYDLLYSDKDYSAEAAYVAGQIRHHLPEARRLVEFGCGTGAHAESLARQGFEIHGIDSSPAMVERALARRAALSSGVARQLSFAVGDIRSVRLERNCDAVISLFHVMSYQTANSDLAGAISSAGRLLKPGGLFFFDFWYGPAVLTQRPEIRIKRLEDDEVRVTRIAEPVVHAERNVVDVDFTVFVEEKSTGAVRQLVERHPMRYLFIPELQQLVSTQFEVLDVHAWMTCRNVGIGDWAACIMLRRIG